MGALTQPPPPPRDAIADRAGVVTRTWGDWFRQIRDLLNRIYLVSGTPQATVAAPIGSLALRIDGGASTTLYVKEADDGLATGWVAK